MQRQKQNIMKNKIKLTTNTNKTLLKYSASSPLLTLKKFTVILVCNDIPINAVKKTNNT